MKLTTKIGSAFGAAALAIVGVGGLAPAQAASSTDGCPTTYVCVMTGSKIVVKWKSYGSHNLDNITGTHRLVNAQTGGAKAYVCKGYDGKDCGGYTFGIPPYIPNTHYLPAQGSDSFNFTPINSIYLSA